MRHGSTIVSGLRKLHARANSTVKAIRKARDRLEKHRKAKVVKPVDGQVYYLIPGKPLHVKQPTSGVDFRAVVFKDGKFDFVVQRSSSTAEKEALAKLNSKK